MSKSNENATEWATEVAKSVGLLAATFGAEFDDLKVEAYRIGLECVGSAAIRQATRAILQSGEHKFMPTPGAIRALAMTDGQGVESRCEAAWMILNKAIDAHGAGRSVNFRDALINATVRLLGGWERCCRMPREEFDKWFRKDFIATYCRLMVHGCPLESAGYLAGECERANGPWVGYEYGKGGKPYELPAPEDVASPYEPALLSAPGAQQLTKRPAGLPTIEFKRA